MSDHDDEVTDATGNGVTVQGFGLQAVVRGAHVVTMFVLMAGIGGLIYVNWAGFQHLQRLLADTQVVMSEVTRRRDADAVRDRQEHAEMLERFDALIYVMALPPKEREQIARSMRPPRPIRKLLEAP